LYRDDEAIYTDILIEIALRPRSRPDFIGARNNTMSETRSLQRLPEKERPEKPSTLCPA